MFHMEQKLIKINHSTNLHNIHQKCTICTYLVFKNPVFIQYSHNFSPFRKRLKIAQIARITRRLLHSIIILPMPTKRQIDYTIYSTFSYN